MSEPFVAEIRLFPFNFAPTGWALCQGQLLPISQNTALFSLLGTTYGGDGKSTFALPDLQGRVPMHPGQGPGLSIHDLGEENGTETVTLLVSEMPSHTHLLTASATDAGERGPGGQKLANELGGINSYAAPAGTSVMAPEAVASIGSSLPHNNLQPSLTLSFAIALQGVYPQRP